MKRAFTADELPLIRYLSYPAVSVPGGMAAYVKSTGDLESGGFESQIVLCHTRSGEILHWPKQEQESRKQPRFLGGGEQLLYLSDRSGVWQLYILDLRSMESRQLTTARHGLVRYSASDSGERLAFEAVLWPEEIQQGLAFTEMSADEKAQWEAELDMRPYEITELIYKRDEWYGMRKGEFSHIGTVSLDGENQRLVDTGFVEACFPSVSHKGEQLAFYAFPHSGAKGRQAELMCCGYDGSGLRVITDTVGIYDDHFPQFLHDDASVICAVYPFYEDGSTVLMPYRVKLDSGEGEYLIQERDEVVCHGLHCVVANRNEYGDASQYFLLSPDDTYLYFQSSFHGIGSIYRVNIREKGKIETHVRGDSDILSFALSEDGKSLAYLMADAHRPAEFYYNGQQLSHENDWLREFSLGEVEDRWITGRDGETRLQYFLVYPVGYHPGQKVPTILYVKGGPETIYNKSFWHQFQALANAGFAVICGNHRGSTGFGRDFCANAVCWRKEAMEDLLDMVHDAVAAGIADPVRLGVTGGSYGGYMTNKLIGRTDTFAAAVSQRSLVNPATSYGTGDMGFVSSREVPKDFKMLDYLVDRARGNIISYVDQMKVPLLILHSYRDYRCSFEQAEQLFIAMKERNPEVPVRLVMFPEENHSLTRSGKLYNQHRHLTELLSWFEKYLMNTADSAPKEET